MSADEEPTSAPTDTPMSEPQSNKRKASIDRELEKDTATSPKRVKLEQPEGETTEAAPTTEDTPAQLEPAAKQEDDTSVLKSESPADTKPQPKPTSPAPRQPPSASPKASRSPTLRPPSIPTPSPNPAPGPHDRGGAGGRGRISEQEKKRGQRLFGGLLSTLSQRTPNNPQAKKRAEIERRQQERAQQQRAEDDRRRAEKLEKLTRVRRVEQVGLDERVMQTRHKYLLLQANTLSTKSEPKLFYLPWKLTDAEYRLLEKQKLDAEENIAQEVKQFQREKVRRLKELGVEVDETEPPAETARQDKEEDQDQRRQSSSSKSAGPDDKSSHADVADREEAGREKSASHDNHHDDPDYVTVENEEDTVIY